MEDINDNLLYFVDFGNYIFLILEDVEYGIFVGNVIVCDKDLSFVFIYLIELGINGYFFMFIKILGNMFVE